MKSKLFLSIFAAATCGLAYSAETAYTTPVGYVTKTLKPNIFSLVGVTLHNPTVAAGILDAVTSGPNTVTDNQVDFTATLSVGSTYILELGDGTVQEITSWSGNVLTTPDDISGLVTPATTKYKLRKASTVSDVFGATNSAGLTPSVDGDFTVNTDLVLIFNGASFDTVYYINDGGGTEGWFDDGGNPAENKVVAYPESLFVQRVAGSDIDLVVSGEVKVDGTNGILTNGFNYLSSVAPAGMTLASSGLSSSVLASPDGDFTVVDNVLIQNPDGSYATHYYIDDGGGTTGWFDDGGNSTDTTPLDGGFLLLNVGGTKPYSIAAPTIAP
jgi:hypothetical protein